MIVGWRAFVVFVVDIKRSFDGSALGALVTVAIEYSMTSCCSDVVGVVMWPGHQFSSLRV
ncbi:hypothetical protein CAURIC_08115 [Corynebacterium auriscanis]|nr:hypothetical protein CAURIC_08115 [Corynebacterium auriscanis]